MEPLNPLPFSDPLSSLFWLLKRGESSGTDPLLPPSPSISPPAVGFAGLLMVWRRGLWFFCLWASGDPDLCLRMGDGGDDAAPPSTCSLMCDAELKLARLMVADIPLCWSGEEGEEGKVDCSCGSEGAL